MIDSRGFALLSDHHETLGETFGRYHLLRRIAIGGMGEVFLARYLNAAGIEQHVIVKRILPHLNGDPDFINYFLNEGRITSLLSHPNVVHTLELGRTNDQYYIAMEYLKGETLVRLLAAAFKFRHAFSIPLVVHIAIQIASALEYIHNLTDLEGKPLQIVHMDLAPHNILISPDGNAKLLDFGISRAVGLSLEPRHREFRGRTAYLAPELLDGLRLDRRVDIFALGIIMHEMVLCRPLFRSQSERQTVTRILYSAIPRIRTMRRDCPEQLEQIIFRALSRDREERYQDASTIIADLDRCAANHGIFRNLTEIRAEIEYLLFLINNLATSQTPTVVTQEPTDTFASHATSLK